MKKISIIAVLIILLGIFGGKWYLSHQTSIPQIDIVELQKDEKIENAKSKLTKEMKLIHYSVDDVFESLVNLSTNQYDSIFEEEHFSFLKKLHDEYDINVSAYVFYDNGEYDLTDVTDGFSSEFQDNADWLKFGFHSLNSDTNYEDSTKQEAKEDYDKVIDELTRITGGTDAVDTTVRLHNYSASNEALKGFISTDNGVEKLLSPEDKRLAYDLNEEQTSYLYQYDYINENGVDYIKTDVRLENLDNVEEFHDSFTKQDDLNDMLVVFTHENYLVDPEIQSKTHELLNMFNDYIPADF